MRAALDDPPAGEHEIRSAPTTLDSRWAKTRVVRPAILPSDDRGDPVVQLAPPLISGQAEFDAIYDILHNVLSEASRRM